MKKLSNKTEGKRPPQKKKPNASPRQNQRKTPELISRNNRINTPRGSIEKRKSQKKEKTSWSKGTELTKLPTRENEKKDN